MTLIGTITIIVNSRSTGDAERGGTMPENRYSRQREAIWSYVKDRHDHPTADQVYLAVREQFPRISLATVYRNLLVLQEQGRLRTVDAGDKVTHFDPHTDEHQHFRCTRCGRLFDIESFEVDEVVAGLDLSGVGRVESYELCVLGICNDCRAAAGTTLPTI